MTDSWSTGAEPAPRVDVAPRVRVAAGSRAVLEVLVTNTATEPRLYAVVAVGVDSTWLPAPLRTPVLGAGESTMVSLEVTPVTGTLPAHYPLLVTVQPLVPGSVPGSERAAAAPSGVGESAVVVNPRAQIALTVGPARTTLVRSQKLRVTVSNTGDSATEVELDDTTSRGIELRLRHRSVTVPAQGEVSFKARLAAVRPRRVGGVADHTWTVTATTAEVVRQARGTAQQRPLFGAAITKVLVVGLVLAIWVGGAIVGLPLVLDKFGGKNEDVSSATIEKSETDGADGADDAAGADGGGADDGGGSDGGAADGGAGSAGATDDDARVLLSGTIAADDPTGFDVSVKRVGLYDRQQPDLETPESTTVQLSAYGKVAQTTVLTTATARSRAVERLPTVTTKDDGAWAIEKVTPGYYVLTIQKAGFDTRRIFVDAYDAEAAGAPREITMAPGPGVLSGRVLGPDGKPFAAASITVSDGSSTLTTTSAANGDARGTWRITGLDAPSSYVVTAAFPGKGTQSRIVHLDAQGSRSVDLTLARGLATLQGVVRGKAPDADGIGGLPEITVSVTDQQGLSRRTTTVSADPSDTNGSDGGVTGHFVLPGVPTPGSYTVTLSGAGFQTQTRKLQLGAGDVPKPIRATLYSATGGVEGKVTALDAGASAVRLNPGGAGLVLANETSTYKVQVAGAGGRYAFAGVAPGTYQLTTTLFGFETGVQTVRVDAGGEPARVDPVIRKLGSGLFTSAAHISFSVAEANVGTPVECGSATGPVAERCTATLEGEDVDPTVAAFAATFETTTLGVTLPSTDAGVAAGLYTLTLRAPGYETQRIKVRVGANDKDLGTIEMFRQPVISGRVTTVSGTPKAGTRTCIWAVPVTAANITTAPSIAGPCGATDATACPALLPSENPATTCTSVAGTGSYALPVAKRGDYWVVVKSGDDEFVAPTPGKVTAPVGSTVPYNVQLNRLGVLNLRVLRSGVSGALSPALDATVTVTPDAATPGTAIQATVTEASGAVRIPKLAPGGYTITSSYVDESANPPVTYTTDPPETAVSVGLDQDVSKILALVTKVTQVPGRVTSVVSGATIAVSGATVEITAPSSYTDTTPVSTTARMVTNAEGCFAVSQDSPGVALAPCTISIVRPALSDASFVSPIATDVTVTAVGYDEAHPANRLSSELNSYVLEPSAREFRTAKAMVYPPREQNPTFAWSDVTFSVESNVTNTSTVSVTADEDGDLVWNDTRYPAGMIKPGTYKVRASLAGYSSSETMTVECGVATTTPDLDTGCAPTGTLTLRKYGSLALTTVSGLATGNPATNAPVNATVTLYRNGELVGTRTASNGLVTFPNLAPSSGEYVVHVKALGYASVDSDTDADIRLACPSTVPKSARNVPITIGAGDETACTATLVRLPGLTGTVRGIQARSPATSPQVSLVGATVTAVRCKALAGGAVPTAATCVEADATAAEPVTRRAAATDAEGKFAFGSTDTIEGFRAGYWLLQATLPGWTASPGTVIEVQENHADYVTDLSLYVTTVTFTVVISDGYGDPVESATVEIGTGAGTTTPATSASGGNYVFADLVPGFYVVSVKSEELITSTFQVEVRIGSDQTFPVFVSKGASAVNGVVNADGAGLAGARVDVVSCLASPCGTTPVKGTDGKTLTVDSTPATGQFSFSSVPDGPYAFRVTRSGYETKTGPRINFDHNTQQSLQTIDLTSSKAEVTVDVVGSLPGDVLTATRDFKLVPVALAGYPTPTAGLAAAGPGTRAQFSAVRYGCWELQLTLPTDHFGSVAVAQSPAASDAVASCASTAGAPMRFGVPIGATAVTVTATVTEAPLGIAVTTAPQTGSTTDTPVLAHPHPAAGTVTVTVTGNGLPTAGVVVPVSTKPAGSAGAAVASRTIWVAPGSSYRATASVAAGGPFWPPVDQSRAVAAAGATVQLDLVELTSAVTVDVSNLAGADGPSQVTLARGSGQTSSVPTAYRTASTIADGASKVFDLPSGTWTFTATPQTGKPVTVQVVVDQLTESVTLEPLPPDGGGGPGTGD